MNDLKFALLIGMVIGCIIILSLESIGTKTISLKKPIRPTITISCINNVCDTTYIYKSK